MKILTNKKLKTLLNKEFWEGWEKAKQAYCQCPTAAKIAEVVEWRKILAHWHCEGCGDCLFNSEDVAQWGTPACNGGSNSWCTKCVG